MERIQTAALRERMRQNAHADLEFVGSSSKPDW